MAKAPAPKKEKNPPPVEDDDDDLKKDDDKQDEGSAPKGGGKLKLILILVAAVVLTAGLTAAGVMMFMGGGSPPPEHGAPPESPEAEHGAPPAAPQRSGGHGAPPEPVSHGGGGGEEAGLAEPSGPVTIKFDSFIVNLNDLGGRRMLKLTMSVPAESQELADEINAKMDPLKDTILTLLSSLQSDDISGIEGKDRLKRQMINRINVNLNRGKVKNLYLLEFVVQ